MDESSLSSFLLPSSPSFLGGLSSRAEMEWVRGKGEAAAAANGKWKVSGIVFFALSVAPGFLLPLVLFVLGWRRRIVGGGRGRGDSLCHFLFPRSRKEKREEKRGERHHSKRDEDIPSFPSLSERRISSRREHQGAGLAGEQ